VVKCFLLCIFYNFPLHVQDYASVHCIHGSLIIIGYWRTVEETYC
jgi:hypothetical protein